MLNINCPAILYFLMSHVYVTSIWGSEAEKFENLQSKVKVVHLLCHLMLR